MGNFNIETKENNKNLEKSREIEKFRDTKFLNESLAKILENTGKYDDIYIYDEKFDPNSKYKIDGVLYETDDKGKIYKENTELIPNTRYEINKIEYVTDARGRIISWEGEPKYKPENERNENAQIESGGKDRREGDDGGHLMARILGGSSGNENIVPMRDTINRGDYKRSENEIIEAKKQGKDIQDSGNIIYNENSIRPSKIERTYIVDNEKNILKVDNIKGSKDLLEDIEESISNEDINILKDEIRDMEEDGQEVSVTSILGKYGKDGNLVSTHIGIRNENTGEKIYRTYINRKDW